MKTLLTLVLAAVTLGAASPSRAASPTELYQQSFSLENAGSYAAALQRMDALAAQGDGDYLLHLRRGWLLYLNGKYVDAADAYTAAREALPTSVEAILGETLPLMALRRWSDAEVACRDLLTLAPGNYLGMSRLAYVLYNSGNYDASETAYRRVVTQYPSDNDMRAGLGWALLRLGRTEEARKEFRTVLRTVPGHVSAGDGLAALK